MSCSEDCKCRPGAVALVFVPGIMGTRLMNKKSGDSVWDPAAGLHFEGPSGAAIEIKAQREQEMAEARADDDDGMRQSLERALCTPHRTPRDYAPSSCADANVS